MLVYASQILSTRPSRTAQRAAQWRGGTTFAKPLTTQPWAASVRKKGHDWFEAGIAELAPAIDAQRTAMQNYKRDP